MKLQDQLITFRNLETVGQVARAVPRIYAALEDCQDDHKSTVVEVGIILGANFYIKMLLFYLINSPIVYFVYSFPKVNHIHPDLGKI